MAFRINHNIPALNALRNLNDTDEDMKQTLERLSSGLKVNRGADGPAALVISEQMRGQIASIEQSIRNSEASISMVQTAEATLTEVNRLLVSLRQLAIHAGNEGANDDKMLAADQAEVENALDTIDRIARTSQFGTRTLFDGSNGTTGVAVGEGLEYVSATPDTKPSPADGYPVNITRPATRAEKRGLRPIRLDDFVPQNGLETSKEVKITISEGGRNITFSSATPEDATVIAKIVESPRTQPQLFTPAKAEVDLQDYVAQRLQRMADQADMKVEVMVERPEMPGPAGRGEQEPGVLVVRHREFGSEPAITVTSTIPEVLAMKAKTIEQAEPGLDIEGTIDDRIAIGRGEFLTAPKNTPADGMTVKFSSVNVIKRRVPKFIPGPEGGVVSNPEIRELSDLVLPIAGSRQMKNEDDGSFVVFAWEVPVEASEEEEGFVHVNQNSLAFQVGPTRDSQVKIALLDVKTGELGKNLPNKSGFESLRDIDVTNAQGAQDAMLLVDDAISQISSIRASLGAFQKNTLEANTSSLRVANENLTAAESSLRDTDMAEEMSRFTRNQIMLSSGIAMLAQANQTPQSVLQLLSNRPQ
jgi:flagellin